MNTDVGTRRAVSTHKLFNNLCIVANTVRRYKSTQQKNGAPFLTMLRLEFRKSIVFRLNLEIALGMCANGANLGSLFADADVTAVDALPDNVLVL